MEAPHFTAHADLAENNDGWFVTYAQHGVAPILKYMRGWNLHKVRMYAAKQGWKVSTHGDMTSGWDKVGEHPDDGDWGADFHG